MNTSLPVFSFKRIAGLAIIAGLQLAFSLRLSAQSGNLLINGSFESPAMTLVNGNNIMGPGNTWGGWSCTNGGLNVLRVSGSGYASGANIADDGNQYIDVANSDGYIYQTFTLANISPVFFSGAFSNREPGWSSYINWTGRVDILDSTGAIVATSTTRSFITTDSKEAWYTLTGASSNLNPGTYRYRAYAGNSGHFDNAVVTALANTVLPIKLKKFTAAAKGKHVIANWEVSEEVNVKLYELQVSTDGVNYKGLGFIPATNSKQYSLLHKTPAIGINYYRLKTHDKDSKVSYSNICSVNFTTGTEINVYPNPSNGSFNLTLSNDMVRKSGALTISNLSGRIVQQRSFTALNQTETIDLRQMTPGTYFVRLTAGDLLVNKTVQVIK